MYKSVCTVGNDMCKYGEQKKTDLLSDTFFGDDVKYASERKLI